MAACRQRLFLTNRLFITIKTLIYTASNTIVRLVNETLREKHGLYFLIAVLTTGCADVSRYNSNDLANLPCERQESEFFFPLEFDENGKFAYPEQITAIKTALGDADRVDVFAHGWDKTTQTAEHDYQDLICRFYARSKQGIHRANRSIIVGVFWPSTEFPRWLNFWKIKGRVDMLARTGFVDFMRIFEDVAYETEKHFSLNFIGHSFGGRLIVHGLKHYISSANMRTFLFLSELRRLQLVLLTAAVNEHSLSTPDSEHTVYKDFTTTWNHNRFLDDKREEMDNDLSSYQRLIDLNQIRMIWNPTLTQLAFYTDVRIFNVFSENDAINRYLFPVGTFFDAGGPSCAIGACRLQQWGHVAKVGSRGMMIEIPDLKKSNVWNIDASEVVKSHSDIYKGRVAGMLWELLSIPEPNFTDEEQKAAAGEPIANDIWLWLLQREHQASMAAINRMRELNVRNRLNLRRFNTLLFDLDGYLMRGHWTPAVQLIHKLVGENYCTPGWWWQMKVGIIDQRAIWNKDSTHVIRGNVCGWPQLVLVLAAIHSRLRNCSESNRLLDLYDKDALDVGTQTFYLVGNDLPRAYELKGAEGVLRDACMR